MLRRAVHAEPRRPSRRGMAQLVTFSLIPLRGRLSARCVSTPCPFPLPRRSRVDKMQGLVEVVVVGVVVAPVDAVQHGIKRQRRPACPTHSAASA